MQPLSRRVLGSLAVVCLTTTGISTVATAGGKGGGHHPPDDEPRLVASGLSNPRHLTVAPNGDVYIAESGAAGPECRTVDTEALELVVGVECGEWDPEQNPTWTDVRAGDSGAITKVTRRGTQTQVVTGLPSISPFEGDFSGPNDVSVRGNKLTFTVGMGGPPALRDLLVEEFGSTFEGLATVQSAKVTHKKVTLKELADLAQFETDFNPHESYLDTNPNAVAPDRNGWLLVDAGGNDALRLNHKGKLSLLKVFEDVLVDAPPWLLPQLPPGVTQIPMEFVPTSIERGPDGAIYVSQLTGFPFPVGGSSIWRISKNGTATEWATGLTNVTDLTFGKNGKLYAVQIADDGLTGEAGLTDGSLLRVKPGANRSEVIATGLFAPYGVAVHKGHAYVTTGSVLPGGGEVWRFDLD